MSLYQYKCDKGHLLERLRPMEFCEAPSICPECGGISPRIMSTFNDHWGWILTEASHHKGVTDTWVPFRPSNETIVDSEKAEYKKEIY